MTPVIYLLASTVELWHGVPQSDNLQVDLKDSAPKIIRREHKMLCRGRETQVGTISCSKTKTKGALIERRKH